VAIALVIVCLTASAAIASATPSQKSPPRGAHVFVINLENKGFDETFGPSSPAPYLSKTLRNPFVYFHSIIDSPGCNKNVVPLHGLAAAGSPDRAATRRRVAACSRRPTRPSPG
jgi:hypothetical protein